MSLTDLKQDIGGNDGGLYNPNSLPQRAPQQGMTPFLRQVTDRQNRATVETLAHSRIPVRPVLGQNDLVHAAANLAQNMSLVNSLPKPPTVPPNMGGPLPPPGPMVPQGGPPGGGPAPGGAPPGMSGPPPGIGVPAAMPPLAASVQPPGTPPGTMHPAMAQPIVPPAAQDRMGLTSLPRG